MHPSPLLDPLFREHVVARQRELYASRTSAALRCRGGRRWRPRAWRYGRQRWRQSRARHRGSSLEPDTCAHRAEKIFTRHGAASILVAKFIPGVTTIMPPLAGVFAVARARFALYDLAGVLLCAGTWLTLGYLFSDAIALITARESSRSSTCSAS